MDRVAVEIEAVAAAAQAAEESQQRELVELQLAYSAGGCADPILF